MAGEDPLDGLVAGSWRGVPFYMQGSKRHSGRRQAEFPLAASDVTLFEDLGLMAGPIEVRGIYVGDDYIAVEAAMRAACETPGPGTLVHPWYGPLNVVLARPGETSFSQNTIRQFEFSAGFKLAPAPSLGGVLSTLGALAGAASGLMGAAGALGALGMGLAGAASAFTGLSGLMGSTILSGIGGSLLSSLPIPALPSLDGVLGSLSGSISSVMSLSSLAAFAPDALLASMGSSMLGSIAGALVGPLAIPLLDAVSAVSWIGSVVDTIAAAGRPTPTPAIAPGPAGRNLTTLITPQQATQALWGVAAAMTPTGTPAQQVLAVAITARALAASAGPLSDMTYESRQEAMSWRKQAVAACDNAQRAAVAVVPLAPQQAGAVWSAVAELRRRIVEDLNERIGRLPAIVSITPPSQVSAWLVAQHVAGDTPARLTAMFDDIATRNRLWHPSIAGPDTIETLP